MADKARLSTGVQSFLKIREDDYIYVDKTEYIYEMTKGSKVYFMSRPRRFGKSLLVSTFEYLFKGRRDLFKGLWIYDSNYDWKEYTVIRFDMSSLSTDSIEELKKSLSFRIKRVAKSYRIKIEDDLPVNDQIDMLIVSLYEKYDRKVVVLVDEYDAPLLSNIQDLEKAKEVREVLKNFYKMFKVLNEQIHFLFFTGITKFAKTSVFSGLNHLDDISFNKEYSDLLGYNQEELEYYFKDYIENLAKLEKLNNKKILAKIRHWYNGYNFSHESISVYNPYSTLLLFKYNSFSNYWFDSGTPTFLIDLIRERGYFVKEQDDFTLSLSEFSKFEIEDIKIKTLLYQSGYLTIKSYDKEGDKYRLSWPNMEVQKAFLEALIMGFSGSGLQVEYLSATTKALYANDMNAFWENIRIFFSNISYDIQEVTEKYYQSILYAVMSFVGIDVETEVRTSDGRMDLVIKTKTHIYIIEIKLNDSAKSAIKQIQEKAYADKYKGDKRRVVLIGVKFDQKKRNIPQKNGWIILE